MRLEVSYKICPSDIYSGRLEVKEAYSLYERERNLSRFAGDTYD
jgi:hypothetical protein